MTSITKQSLLQPKKSYRSQEISLLSIPDNKPVLWLVYDRRNNKVQCLVSEVRWFTARAKGAQDLQIDLQYVVAARQALQCH